MLRSTEVLEDNKLMIIGQAFRGIPQRVASIQIRQGPQLPAILMLTPILLTKPSIRTLKMIRDLDTQAGKDSSEAIRMQPGHLEIDDHPADTLETIPPGESGSKRHGLHQHMEGLLG